MGSVTIIDGIVPYCVNANRAAVAGEFGLIPRPGVFGASDSSMGASPLFAFSSPNKFRRLFPPRMDFFFVSF